MAKKGEVLVMKVKQGESSSGCSMKFGVEGDGGVRVMAKKGEVLVMKVKQEQSFPPPPLKLFLLLLTQKQSHFSPVFQDQGDSRFR
ncbi:hypothetical protein V6N11_027460 [Hibiscus sabdariffa]|uniref:Uncharacterized protein n=1 Tax=Hibiscus sabdariffa TaxID=183260 RepID=A0ABR2PH41_9ROSI